VDILGKDRKKGEDSKKRSKHGREERGVARQNEETEIPVNRLYNEIRRLNRNLENAENTAPQNSSSNLSNLLGNLDLTKIIGILTVINSLLNNNQLQQTQSLPNMIQQMLPLLDMASTNTDSTK
jgi:ATP-dependent helicase/DNAse subunit B